MGLMIGALSVSMFAGCGSDKEVEKVDDSRVQISEASTESALDGTDESANEGADETAADIVYGDVVEELGLTIEEVYADYLVATETYWVATGVYKDGELTDETVNLFTTTALGKYAYDEEAMAKEEESIHEDEPYRRYSSGASVYVGTDLRKYPSKEGYVKTYFQIMVQNLWGTESEIEAAGYGLYWSAYDRNTGICLMPSGTQYEESGATIQEVTIIAEDGTEYDCAFADSCVFNEDYRSIYVTMAIEHPADYDPSSIIFVVGGKTVSSEAYMENLEDTGERSNLRDLTGLWTLRKALYFAYGNK